MNSDKQIDEMAKDLCHTDTCEIKKIGIPCNHRCKAHIYATRAIDKGYRKASEVIDEFAERVKSRFFNGTDRLYSGYNIHRCIDQIAKEMIGEEND